MDVWSRVVALRTEIIDQLDGLPPDRWDAPTLCPGWRVRDVVAHLILPERMSSLAGLVAFARTGFNIGRYLEADAVRRGSVPLEELIAAYRESIGRRTLPPGRRPEHLLDDLFIHAQDIRRPLGLPCSGDEALLTLVATTVAADRGLRAPGRIAGLRLRALDIDWSSGSGDEVTGPAEALILAMSGRDEVLPELSGSGLETLASRLS
ncbi:MAG: maleylpyruvate isomerase family mycothiol-dependent enzyme [Dactylosporangium sp.]|nr:maleylpyruvate isomerase family mycothiol-dependent enzyme [Dactylosporangium sp.]NNJ62414.1 maleylpyruvate isomerase family mycothiol-dependent enzyme [Dactylosporangium sp.]